MEAATAMATAQQRKSKIDRRLLADLGCDSENVFYTQEVSAFKKVFVHISIDSSGSMIDNSKWQNALCCAVAIAVAASMIENLEVVISFRSSTLILDEDYIFPWIMIAYDSRRDHLSKIRTLFPHLSPRGYTPEGLAFESILKMIPPSNYDADSYFLNISDGFPFFDSHNPPIFYHGTEACGHTRKQVQKMRNNGVQILSYFISSGTADDEEMGTEAQFKIMYGPAAKFISFDNVNEIAYTMNKKFLESYGQTY